MAHDSGESLASQDSEASLSAYKRKFDEMVNRNSDRGKAGLPAAPGPSCNSLRPPLTEFDVAKQSILDHVERFKRPRAEDESGLARSNGLDPRAAFADDNCKCGHCHSAKETLFMRHQQFQQGAHCCSPGGSNQREKVNVPNMKASEQAVAGGAGVVVALEDGGVRMSHGKVTVSIDLRSLNQGTARPFTIKFDPQNSNVECCWGQ